MTLRRLLLGLCVCGLVVVSSCAQTDDTAPVVTDLPALDGPADSVVDTVDSTPDGSTPTSSAPNVASTTTVAPEQELEPEPAQSFAGPGPYFAGVTTLDLGDRQADVWYPVDAADVEGLTTEVFDTLSVFPDSLKDLIPAELSGDIDTHAFRDAVVSLDAPFPVVVYSHGFGGYRQTATAYTTHLASWGFVVISTDHVERGIAAQATSQLKNIPGRDVRDVSRSLEALHNSALGASVDLEHVGITGHSAGAGTAARAAIELDEIDSFVSISGGAPVVTTGDDIGASVQIQGEGTSHRVDVQAVTDVDATIAVDGGTPQVVPLDALSVTAGADTITLVPVTGERLRVGTVRAKRAAPTKPGLIVAAERDTVVDPAASAALYRMLTGSAQRVEIADAGHNSFTDSCAGIREMGGLQSLVDVIGEAQVARAENGCTARFADPVVVTQVLGHYSVAFFRTTLGVADDTATSAVDITPTLDDISLSAFSSRN